MFNHIVVGGTFDGLHVGHEYFLKQACNHAYLVTIGLTSEAYIRRFKKDSRVAPYSTRYRALTSWLRVHGFASKVQIIPLDNKWGPVLLPDGFDAIAVTKHNKSVAEEINIVRFERGLPRLTIVEVDLVPSEDQNIISSTRVRKGEIDKKGNLRLPDSLRPELQKLLGNIIPADQIKRILLLHKDDIIITVGDVTTETIFYCGIQPSLAIIDLHVERKPYRSLKEHNIPKKYQIIHVTSGPGYISKKALSAIASWKKDLPKHKRVAIVVDGEEDLLVLPAIDYAPIGSFVYYGSPPVSGNEGLVEVKVTLKMKRTVRLLMKQFVS